MPSGDVDTEHLKRRASSLSLIYNALLTVMKLGAAMLTGSVSLFTEAAHSAIDVVASTFAFFSVRAAAIPPDDDHNYGHGKIETFAGFGESVLLFVVVVYAVYEAIQRLVTGTMVGHASFGIAAMALSAILNLSVGAYVGKAGAKTGSIALQSNGQHLMVDFWTSLGVLAALLVGQLTGWRQADPIFAIVLSLWICRGAYLMSRRAFQQLIDRRLSDDELRRITAILAEVNGLKGYHKLRTRQSGDTRYVEVHIEVPSDWTVVQAHALADLVETRIQDSLAPAVATIHVDPVE